MAFGPPTGLLAGISWSAVVVACITLSEGRDECGICTEFELDVDEEMNGMLIIIVIVIRCCCWR